MLQHAQHLGREHAHFDFGQAKHRVARRHRHVAHRQQAHATGHAGAVDAGNQRHVTGTRGAQQLCQVTMRLGIVGGKGLGRLQISAGAKGLDTGPGDNDGAQVALALGRRNCLRHAGQHAVAHGVAPFFARDRQPQHRAALFHAQFRCG